MMGLSRCNHTISIAEVFLPTPVPIYIPNTKLKLRSAVFLKSCWIPDTILSIAWKRKEVSGTFPWLQGVHRLEERTEMKHSNLYHLLKIEWLRHHVQPGLKVAIPAGVDTQRRLHGAEKGRDRGFWRERASGMDFLTPFYIVETRQLMPHEAGDISWACLPTSFAQIFHPAAINSPKQLPRAGMRRPHSRWHGDPLAWYLTRCQEGAGGKSLEHLGSLAFLCCLSLKYPEAGELLVPTFSICRVCHAALALPLRSLCTLWTSRGPI